MTYRAWTQGLIETPETPALVLGDLVHNLLLEPDVVRHVAGGPCMAKTQGGTRCRNQASIVRRNDNGAHCKFCKRHDIKELDLLDAKLVTTDQMKLAMGMSEAVRQHPVASRFVESGLEYCATETVHYGEAHGIASKCKPDILFSDYVVDLKTTTEPKEFERKIFQFGYHRQAAWYRATLGQERRHIFIVVDKAFPHDVWTYELAPVALRQGYLENEEIVDHIRFCRDADNWSDRGQNEMQFVSLPDWYMRKHNNRLSEEF